MKKIPSAAKVIVVGGGVVGCSTRANTISSKMAVSFFMFINPPKQPLRHRDTFASDNETHALPVISSIR